MEIKRDVLLKRLMDLRHNGMIKVITGMRRCGKSYLLFKLFSEALKAEGVDNEHIVKVNLEDRRNKVLRDPTFSQPSAFLTTRNVIKNYNP